MAIKPKAIKKVTQVKLSASKAIAKQPTKKNEASKVVAATEPASVSVDNKQLIISALQKIMSIYESTKEKGKVMGYRRAIYSIKSFDKPITNADQLDGVPGIGSGIKKKVAEFLQEGKMSKLQELKSDNKVVILDQLGQIWGVGPVAALKLYEAGIRSIEDLQKKQDLLTRAQKIGLKYYKDFQEKIPREMATTMFQLIEKEVKSLFGQKVQVQICGSYRRGRATCGDVDVLITKTDDKPVAGMLEQILLRLEKQGFLKERLSNSRNNDKGSEMYMGVCKAPTDTHFRRIDIKVYPKDQYGFALLYFTGSDYHNRQMRAFAESKGLTLSDHGLVKIGEKGSDYKCETEEDVFKALGLPYKTPAERDV